MDRTRTLGQIIRSRRLAMGMTQEELAARIGDGVRQAEVSRLECDRVGLPRRRRLERIAAALDLRLGELLATAGWAGADQEFGAPKEHAVPVIAPSTIVAPRTVDPLPARQDPPSMQDLREAMVRAQETHWRTLQLLNTSRELAATWNGVRVRRSAPRST